MFNLSLVLHIHSSASANHPSCTTGVSTIEKKSTFKWTHQFKPMLFKGQQYFQECYLSFSTLEASLRSFVPGSANVSSYGLFIEHDDLMTRCSPFAARLLSHCSDGLVWMFANLFVLIRSSVSVLIRIVFKSTIYQSGPTV